MRGHFHDGFPTRDADCTHVALLAMRSHFHHFMPTNQGDLPQSRTILGHARPHCHTLTAVPHHARRTTLGHARPGRPLSLSAVDICVALLLAMTRSGRPSHYYWPCAATGRILAQSHYSWPCAAISVTCRTTLGHARPLSQRKAAIPSVINYRRTTLGHARPLLGHARPVGCRVALLLAMRGHYHEIAVGLVVPGQGVALLLAMRGPDTLRRLDPVALFWAMRGHCHAVLVCWLHYFWTTTNATFLYFRVALFWAMRGHCHERRHVGRTTLGHARPLSPNWRLSLPGVALL